MPFCGTYDAIRSSTIAFTQTTFEKAKLVAGEDCKSVYVCGCQLGKFELVKIGKGDRK